MIESCMCRERRGEGVGEAVFRIAWLALFLHSGNVIAWRGSSDLQTDRVSYGAVWCEQSNR